MPGQFYGRWVPPKPATVSRPPPTASSPRTTFALEPETPQQSKKPRKEKSKRKSSEETGVAEGVEARPETLDPAVPAPSKKPKKRKRESQVEDEPEEATPKKFKGVLSKFEKASKRAAEAARESENQRQEENDQEVEPAEKLHGTFLVYILRDDSCPRYLGTIIDNHRSCATTSTGPGPRYPLRADLLYITSVARRAHHG